jgi:hypothetical protein
MKLGIVGHAAEKFNPQTEMLAREAIANAIKKHKAKVVVSGACHMGGIDAWAEEIAEELSLPTIIHQPRSLHWNAPGGFRDRNLKIVRDSDLVLCVVVAKLPKGFAGARFSECYHCGTARPPHVKSGGCWTVMQARRGEWRIIHANKWVIA